MVKRSPGNIANDRRTHEDQKEILIRMRSRSSSLAPRTFFPALCAVRFTFHFLPFTFHFSRFTGVTLNPFTSHDSHFTLYDNLVPRRFLFDKTLIDFSL